jgi:hypothetical protein
MLALLRVREDRAEAALRAASHEAAEAASAADRAARVARSFAALRTAQSAVISRRLATGPQAAGRVADAAAELLDLSARAGALAERKREADARAAERARLRNRAATEHAAAAGHAEAWAACLMRLDAAASSAAERREEDAAEEMATLRGTGARWTA